MPNCQIYVSASTSDAQQAEHDLPTTMHAGHGSVEHGSADGVEADDLSRVG